MSPLVGGSMPARTLMVLDFPISFGPSRTQASPLFTSNLISSTAARVPNVIRRLRQLIMIFNIAGRALGVNSPLPTHWAFLAPPSGRCLVGGGACLPDSALCSAPRFRPQGLDISLSACRHGRGVSVAGRPPALDLCAVRAPPAHVAQEHDRWDSLVSLAVDPRIIRPGLAAADAVRLDYRRTMLYRDSLSRG